jgi:hypothetical protein
MFIAVICFFLRVIHLYRLRGRGRADPERRRTEPEAPKMPFLVHSKIIFKICFKKSIQLLFHIDRSLRRNFLRERQKRTATFDARSACVGEIAQPGRFVLVLGRSHEHLAA